MTKTEFYEEVTDFSSLVDFCECNDFYEIIEDFKHEDDFDEWVWDTLEECRSNSYWYEAKDWLQNLESPDTEWILVTGFLRYENLYDNDLRYWMDKVVEAGYECDFWEPEDLEDDYVDDDIFEDPDSTDEPAFEAGFVLSQLIGVA